MDNRHSIIIIINGFIFFFCWNSFYLQKKWFDHYEFPFLLFIHSSNPFQMMICDMMIMMDDVITNDFPPSNYQYISNKNVWNESFYHNKMYFKKKIHMKNWTVKKAFESNERNKRRTTKKPFHFIIIIDWLINGIFWCLFLFIYHSLEKKFLSIDKSGDFWLVDSGEWEKTK